MNKKNKILMNIEVWSDFLCPWCYIGDTNLKQAIKELDINVEIEHKSFQSNPGQRKAETIYQIATRNGMSLDFAKNKARNIETMAKDAGLDFKMDDVLMVNTFDAHRLAHYMKSLGDRETITEMILQASFIYGKDISDHEQLSSIVEKLNIDRLSVKSILDSSQYINEVQDEIKEGIKKGVQGVPYYIINGKYVLYGARTKEYFKKEIIKILKKEGNTIEDNNSIGFMCDGDSCLVK